MAIIRKDDPAYKQPLGGFPAVLDTWYENDGLRFVHPSIEDLVCGYKISIAEYEGIDNKILALEDNGTLARVSSFGTKEAEFSLTQFLYNFDVHLRVFEIRRIRGTGKRILCMGASPKCGLITRNAKLKTRHTLLRSGSGLRRVNGQPDSNQMIRLRS